MLEGITGDHVANLLLNVWSPFRSNQAAQSWVLSPVAFWLSPEMKSTQPSWAGYSTAWIPWREKDFPHGKFDPLLFQFKPVFSSHCVPHPTLLSWYPPCRAEQVAVRSPAAISRLSASAHRAAAPASHPLWCASTELVCNGFLLQGIWNWTQPSRYGLTSAEQGGWFLSSQEL